MEIQATKIGTRGRDSVKRFATLLGQMKHGETACKTKRSTTVVFSPWPCTKKTVHYDSLYGDNKAGVLHNCPRSELKLCLAIASPLEGWSRTCAATSSSCFSARPATSPTFPASKPNCCGVLTRPRPTATKASRKCLNQRRPTRRWSARGSPFGLNTAETFLDLPTPFLRLRQKSGLFPFI